MRPIDFDTDTDPDPDEGRTPAEGAEDAEATRYSREALRI
jgi:hypothetical protein